MSNDDGDDGSLSFAFRARLDAIEHASERKVPRRASEGSSLKRREEIVSDRTAGRRKVERGTKCSGGAGDDGKSAAVGRGDRCRRRRFEGRGPVARSGWESMLSFPIRVVEIYDESSAKERCAHPSSKQPQRDGKERGDELSPIGGRRREAAAAVDRGRARLARSPRSLSLTRDSRFVAFDHRGRT